MFFFSFTPWNAHAAMYSCYSIENIFYEDVDKECRQRMDWLWQLRCLVAFWIFVPLPQAMKVKSQPYSVIGYDKHIDVFVYLSSLRICDWYDMTPGWICISWLLYHPPLPSIAHLKPTGLSKTHTVSSETFFCKISFINLADEKKYGNWHIQSLWFQE